MTPTHSVGLSFKVLLHCEHQLTHKVKVLREEGDYQASRTKVDKEGEGETGGDAGGGKYTSTE